MRWSTGGTEEFLRKVWAPMLGSGLLIGESMRDGPERGLIIAAAVGLIVGQPFVRALDRRSTPAAQGDPPPSPADPGPGPS